MSKPDVALQRADAIQKGLQELKQSIVLKAAGRLESSTVEAARKSVKALQKKFEARPRGMAGPPLVRTIHHLSCTGGTLIAKCIASMTNVIVLNEIDLQSSQVPSAKGQFPFTPTDLVALLRQGDRFVPEEELANLFLAGVQAIAEDERRRGRNLVLRDHTHSHFLTGSEPRSTPTLREIVGQKFPTASIVTVRDPVDSFLSMKKQNWHQSFEPSTFEEYCRRYLHFLQCYKTVKIIKYEDLVEAPQQVMQVICDELELEYFEQFEEVYGAFRFSGDSGRRGHTGIASRPRRELENSFIVEAGQASSYEKLARTLGYEKVA
nr:sulfotransferase [uncultured Hyphomonas sp.]